MKNKVLNLMLDITGLVLLLSSNWIAEKSIAAKTGSITDISGILAITGTILILFTIINFTSILFSGSFNTNLNTDKRRFE